MIDQPDPQTRSPRPVASRHFRRLRWIALVLAIIASLAAVINHGHGIMMWLTLNQDTPDREAI